MNNISIESNFSNQPSPIQNMMYAYKALTGMLSVNDELMKGVPGLAIQDYKALNDAPIAAKETADKIVKDLKTIGIVLCQKCNEFISVYQIPDCPYCHDAILHAMEEDGFTIDWERKIVVTK